MGNEKVYQMDFSKVYRLLVDKAERKGRTREEVDEIIRWLTGYGQTELEGMLTSLPEGRPWIKYCVNNRIWGKTVLDNLCVVL